MKKDHPLKKTIAELAAENPDHFDYGDVPGPRNLSEDYVRRTRPKHITEILARRQKAKAEDKR